MKFVMNNKLKLILWIILFLFEGSNIIYWNFISSKPFDIYTAWINTLCFIGGITLG